METVVSPPDPNVLEVRLLTEWEDVAGGRRRRKAAAISVVLHAAFIALLAVLPRSVLEPMQQAVARQITPLIAPLTEPTQTVPNKAPLNKEFNAESLQPRPGIHIPPSPPSTTRPAAPQLRPPSPPPAPPPTLAEPPQMAAAAPSIQSPIRPVAPPPQIQPQEAPRMTLENVAPSGAPGGRGTGRVAIPDASVQGAIRNLSRGGAGGGLTVGDIGEAGPGGIGEGVNLPPSPGRQASNLELLSDPMGVDFRPYLIRILAAVRRNWFAVMPESAKLGRQGRVSIQFAVARNGSVPKLVIVGHSGTEAFDRAAVAGISASNPFPPLPPEFKGDQIRLQFNFAYNIPRNRP